MNNSLDCIANLSFIALYLVIAARKIVHELEDKWKDMLIG